jgi:hypothetical protein
MKPFQSPSAMEQQSDHRLSLTTMLANHQRIFQIMYLLIQEAFNSQSSGAGNLQ